MTSRQRSLRTFYTLILTQTFSLIGSQMTGIALGIWVYQDTGSATPLALVAFFSAVPRIIAPSFAGVLADRWDRRYVMVIADIGQAVGTALLMFSFLFGTFALWQLYVVSAVSAAFAMFQGPAFQASVTMLIPDDQRDRANALQQLTGPAAGIVAPMLTGLIFAAVNVAGEMAIDLFTFIAAMIVVMLVHIPRPEQTAEGRAAQGTLWQEAQVGFRYLWERRPLFMMLLSAMCANFFFNMVGVLFTPYVLSLTGSETTLGVLMSVMSAGAIVGGIIMGVWGGTPPRIHTILPGIMITGLLFGVFGITRAPVLMGMALFGMMIPLPIINAAFMSVLQIKTPADLQGRVFAAVTQIAMLLSPISYLLAGPLADQVFEPAVGTAAWDVVAPLVGTQEGAGIGLMAVIAGTLIILSSAAFYALPMVRHMEATLPDYEAVAAEEVSAEDPVSEHDPAALPNAEPTAV
ncbi:MAG: MFS transporter [Anaerolineae bacterium]|nr:MFS transporter [Anaerolineae bacterium]